MVEADCPQNFPGQPALLMSRRSRVTVCLPSIEMSGSDTLQICVGEDMAVIEAAGDCVAAFACADPIIRAALLDAEHVQVLAGRNSAGGFAFRDGQVSDSVCEKREMRDDQ